MRKPDDLAASAELHECRASAQREKGRARHRDARCLLRLHCSLQKDMFILQSGVSDLVATRDTCVEPNLADRLGSGRLCSVRTIVLGAPSLRPQLSHILLQNRKPLLNYIGMRQRHKPQDTGLAVS
jgi:hypothetical protein